MKQHLTVTTAPSTEAEKADPYFDYRPLVGGFNDHYDAYFYPSYAACIDETMLHWYGRGLPHLSYIPWKPKGLGTEVKTLCDYMCGLLFRMELQESAGAMGVLLKAARDDFGGAVGRAITKTTACVLRLTRKLHYQSGPAGRRRDVIGDSWFARVEWRQPLLLTRCAFILWGR